jgi:cytochrome d ubiquinol oxidase subunit I
MDVVSWHRAQFALTIMFHYLFPPLSIGLGLMLTLLEGRWLWRKDPDDHALARFFTKLFAANFAVGVASGIVMEFQFGTNWATYSRFVGDVFGSALAAEGIFAFFLESGFLAVLVFGWDRVGKKMHFFSTLMVFFGSVFSSVWIVIANSWQQTPAGHRLVTVDGQLRAEIVDFWAMVFNPSSMHRLGHVLLAAFVLGSYFVMSVLAFYLLRDRHRRLAEKGFTLALFVSLAASLLLLVSGHHQADAVAHNQPAKLAAFEGHFETGPAAMYLFGLPSAETKRVEYGVGVPGMLSYLVHGDAHAEIRGIESFPPEDRPPLVVPFVSYHLMAMLGFLFIGLSALGLLLRKRLFHTRWLLWVYVFAVLGPYAANESGWVAAETGRQPWVVYGLLRTKDAASRVVPKEHVMASIAIFSFLYLLLLFVWLFVMSEKIKHGPEAHDGDAHGSLIDVATVRTDPASQESMT